MSNLNSLKRYIICFKKNDIEGNLTKNIKIVKSHNQADAEIKLCNNENIPRQIIRRDSLKEGIIYCNRIYNARFDDEISIEKIEADEVQSSNP